MCMYVVCLLACMSVHPSCGHAFMYICHPQNGRTEFYETSKVCPLDQLEGFQAKMKQLDCVTIHVVIYQFPSVNSLHEVVEYF